jgi:predicted RNA-binding protein (TIGR00451 family)
MPADGVQGLDDAITRVRGIADYQFGRGVGSRLFPENVRILYSRRTGRIRYVYLDNKRLATLRPTAGLFSLSIAGTKRIIKNSRSAKCIVTVQNEVSGFIAEGGDVFSAHVVRVNPEVRARDEVIVVDKHTKVLAVGRAVLSADEMKAFKRGVAVKVRRGSSKES